MIQAKWLFEHHLQHEALATFCKERLNQLSLQSMKDDAISSIFFSRDSGFPHTGNSVKYSSGSSTEYAALHWIEHLDPATLNEYHQLKHDLEKYQYYSQLFNTVIAGLAPKEIWLIKKFYIEGLSLSQIISEENSPYAFCCRTTVYNHKKEILKKAALIISLCTKKGEMESQ